MHGWRLTIVAVALAALGGLVAPPLPVPLVVPTSTTVRSGALSMVLTPDRMFVLPGDTGRRVVRLEIIAAPAAAPPAPPRADVVLVLDESGSMSERNRLEGVGAAVRSLLAEGRPEDTISLVAFQDDARVLLPPTPMAEAHAVHSALRRLSPAGATNLYAGISSGLSLFGPPSGAQNLLILSDGKANVGPTDQAALLHGIRRARAQGITVSTIGLGPDHDEDLLMAMADIGGGTYAYDPMGDHLPLHFQQALARRIEHPTFAPELTVDPGPGVHRVELLGRFYEPRERGLSASLGALAPGDTLRLYVAVEGQAPATGVWPLVTVQVHDAAGASPPVTGQAVIGVTGDVEVAHRSTQVDSAAATLRGYGLLLDAIEARRVGDHTAAQEDLAEARRWLDGKDTPSAEQHVLEAELALEHASSHPVVLDHAEKVVKEGYRDAIH